MTDRVIPHNLEAERTLLASFHVWPKETLSAIENLRPTDFHLPRHRFIFEAMQAIAERGHEPDVILLLDELKRSGALEACGGNAGVAEAITRPAETPVNLAPHAEIVRNLAGLREVITAANEIERLGYDGHDAAEVAGRALDLLRPVVDRTNGDLQMWKLEDLLAEHIDLLEQRQGGNVEGLMTGWHDLDEILGGLRAGELIVIGARPSMGKSVMGVNIAEHAAGEGKSVLFASLEMSKEQLLDRMLSKASPVALSRILNGVMDLDDWAKVYQGAGVLADYGINLVVNPTITMDQIHAAARRMTPRCDLIVIDYLGLVQARPGAWSRNEAVGEMARQAKVMGMVMGCPVVLLCQLSRKVEDRADRRPMMSDLRDSGEIEQHADDVLLLLREEHYWPGQKPGIVEVMIEKNRNGVSGTSVELAFLGHQARISNMRRASMPERNRKDLA